MIRFLFKLIAYAIAYTIMTVCAMFVFAILFFLVFVWYHQLH